MLLTSVPALAPNVPIEVGSKTTGNCVSVYFTKFASALASSPDARYATVTLFHDALEDVLSRLPSPPTTVVISGRGEFLARRVIEQLGLTAKVVSLSAELGPDLSRAATAHAVAVLAREGPR